MSREWKPGDVAIVTISGSDLLAVRGRGIFGGKWYTAGPVLGSRTDIPESMPSNVRPLVVIDPEDREQVARLRDAIDPSRLFQPLADYQAALRSLIAPPRPPEPTGLGAVVEDEDGERWISHEPDLARADDKRHRWYPAGYVQDRVRQPWDQITAVRVLSEGVQP